MTVLSTGAGAIRWEEVQVPADAEQNSGTGAAYALTSLIVLSYDASTMDLSFSASSAASTEAVSASVMIVKTPIGGRLHADPADNAIARQ